MKESLVKIWQKIKLVFSKVNIPHRSFPGLLLHIRLALALSVFIVWYIFEVKLPADTLHGQEMIQPDFSNKNFSEAQTTIAKMGLRDSVFRVEWSSKHAPNAIISQKPEAGSSVKQDRRTYFVLNTAEIPKHTITPKIYADLKRVNNSKAIYTLHAINMRVQPKYIEEENGGYVYDCKVDGKSVEAGDVFPIGTLYHLFFHTSCSRYIVVEKR